MFTIFKQPSLTFEFRGDVRPEPTREELAILEAAAKRARSFRPLSPDQQRRQTIADQTRAAVRIWIGRPVLNYEDFKPQMGAWHIQETAGTVKRRKFGTPKSGQGLHVTLVSTGDANELLGTIDDTLAEEDLQRRLNDRCPDLFKETGQVAFTELELFGDKKLLRPWAALPISPAARSLHAERDAIRKIIAPNCGESGNRLHTSLGDIIVDSTHNALSTFAQLKRGVAPLLPEYGVFGPARIVFEPNPPSRQ